MSTKIECKDIECFKVATVENGYILAHTYDSYTVGKQVVFETKEALCRYIKKHISEVFI